MTSVTLIKLSPFATEYLFSEKWPARILRQHEKPRLFSESSARSLADFLYGRGELHIVLALITVFHGPMLFLEISFLSRDALMMGCSPVAELKRYSELPRQTTYTG